MTSYVSYLSPDTTGIESVHFISAIAGFIVKDWDSGYGPPKNIEMSVLDHLIHNNQEELRNMGLQIHGQPVDTLQTFGFR